MKSILFVLLALVLAPVFAQDYDAGTIEMGIADQINDYRIKNGLNPWVYDFGIENLAKVHSQDNIDKGYFGHYTLGTLKGPGFRGAMGGYAICGEPFAVQRYFDVGNELKEWDRKADEYDAYKARVEPIIEQGLAPNAQELYDELVRKYDNLRKSAIELDVKVNEVNHDIDMDKVGVGFIENMMEVDPLSMVTTQDILDNAVPGWIDSPGHKQVLDGYGAKMGVGIAYNDSRMVITLDVC